MRDASGAEVCGVIEACGFHGAILLSALQLESCQSIHKLGASIFGFLDAPSVAGSGETTSCFFGPFTRLSEVCLSGLRVRTVIVSRVTRELLSVLRSVVEFEVACLRAALDVFLSVADEPERW